MKLEIILASLITGKSGRNVPLNIPWQSCLPLNVWTLFLQKFSLLFLPSAPFSHPLHKNGMILEKAKSPRIAPRHLNTQGHWTVPGMCWVTEAAPLQSWSPGMSETFHMWAWLHTGPQPWNVRDPGIKHSNNRVQHKKAFVSVPPGDILCVNPFWYKHCINRHHLNPVSEQAQTFHKELPREQKIFFCCFLPGYPSIYAGTTLRYFGNGAPPVKLTLDSPWQVIVAGNRADDLRLSKQIQVSRKMKGFEGKPFGSSLPAVTAVIFHMTATTSISFSLIWSLCDSPSNSGVNLTAVS